MKPKMHADLMVRKAKTRAKEIVAAGDRRDRIFLAHTRSPKLTEFEELGSALCTAEWVALLRADGWVALRFTNDVATLIGGFMHEEPTATGLDARVEGDSLKAFRKRGDASLVRAVVTRTLEHAESLKDEQWTPAPGSEVPEVLERFGRQWVLTHPALVYRERSRYSGAYWDLEFTYHELDEDGRRTGRRTTLNKGVSERRSAGFGVYVRGGGHMSMQFALYGGLGWNHRFLEEHNLPGDTETESQRWIATQRGSRSA